MLVVLSTVNPGINHQTSAGAISKMCAARLIGAASHCYSVKFGAIRRREIQRKWLCAFGVQIDSVWESRNPGMRADQLTGRVIDRCRVPATPGNRQVSVCLE